MGYVFFTVIVALTHDMTIIPFKKCLQPCGNVSGPPNILPHNGLFFPPTVQESSGLP